MMKFEYLFILLFLINPVSALTITPDGPTHVVIEPGTTYNFSYTADGVTTLSEFYLDGVKTETSDKYKEYVFSDPDEYHNVTTIASDGLNASNAINYNVLVQRQVANTPISEFNESDYEAMMENLEEDDWEGLAADATKPFTYILGRLFYLVLFVLPYGLMWMKQQKLTIPVVLSLILGSLFIGFVPEQYKEVLIGVIALSYAVNLYLITRER